VLKKVIFGAAALVAVGIFVGPMAANAAYVPTAGTVTGPETPGSADTVSFGAGSFMPGEKVDFTVTGAGDVTIAMLRADTESAVETASASGAVSATVTLPSDATGTYSVTATGEQSGNVGSAAIPVHAIGGTGPGGSGGTTTGAGGSSGGASTSSGGSTSSDNGSGLADTGSNVPMLAIWGATGAVGLGAALVVVLLVVRKQRLSDRA
jgi:hypothetical protein